MRKDKGLSTDIDRLPLLTWIMFLKFLDELEQIEESKAKMRSERYRPAIEPPYRWRDWAAKEDGITSPELLAYLRALEGGNGSARRRRVIATVFKDVANRMLSGYLLRDVLNKVTSIHFLAKEELFTLGHLYETMLREMRDAAGCNLDRKNPRAKEDIAHLPPEQLAASILEKERKIIEIMERVKRLLEKGKA